MTQSDLLKRLENYSKFLMIVTFDSIVQTVTVLLFEELEIVITIDSKSC
ncbi:hypothetical protein HYD77_00810 [Mycoplasmopsis bovis]|nr:hypothetical protein HYD77_00810 [Mycoplasmopsis bovis]